MLDFGRLLNSTLRLGTASRSVRFSVAGRHLQALVPADSVFFSIKDILFNREYEFFPQFELTHPRQIVVDVGAHAGLYTIIASLSASKVLALEPDNDIFRILSTNITRNSLTNVNIIESALWTKDGFAKFHRRGNSQLGSVRTRRNSEPILVQANSLPHLLSDALQGVQGRKIDLLKLDIEGTEFDVIPSSDQETLGKIAKMVVEVHTEHGKIEALTSKLKQCGFSYVIVKRPFRKAVNGEIRVLGNYKLRLLMETVNLAMGVSNYSDWSSLLLFASRQTDDFPQAELSSIKERVVETSLERPLKTKTK